MANISFAITAHNEHVELDRLLKQLTSNIKSKDEIVVQLDTTATDEVVSVIEKYNLIKYYFPLNNDFSTFKNKPHFSTIGTLNTSIISIKVPSGSSMYTQ